MDFQWYPGHMTKAKRMMQENMKLIDLVIEVTDARIPLSSRNPDIDELGKNKARLILLNKADLADDNKTEKWMEYFRGKGYYAFPAKALIKVDFPTLGIPTTMALTGRFKIPRLLSRSIFSLQDSIITGRILFIPVPFFAFIFTA